MNYKGTIIEESLENKTILKSLRITETRIEAVSERHKTPWIKKWTLDTFEISEQKADLIAKKISLALDSEHPWYVDFKNAKYHFVIFKNKVFKVKRTNKEEYDKAIKFGISLGIPDYQMDLSPNVL